VRRFHIAGDRHHIFAPNGHYVEAEEAVTECKNWERMFDDLSNAVLDVLLPWEPDLLQEIERKFGRKLERKP
jgi:hypothetical protein